jgi:hypothetical protein
MGTSVAPSTHSNLDRSALPEEQMLLSALLKKVVDSAIRRGKTFTAPIVTPGGIASLEPIDLNGYEQWLLIRGHDVSKPVLLFLHGGPGSAEMWFAHHSMRELEKHFVCVNWDQRGAGKSFRPDPRAGTMTMAQFVDDAIVLRRSSCGSKIRLTCPTSRSRTSFRKRSSKSGACFSNPLGSGRRPLSRSRRPRICLV